MLILIDLTGFERFGFSPVHSDPEEMEQVCPPHSPPVMKWAAMTVFTCHCQEFDSTDRQSEISPYHLNCQAVFLISSLGYGLPFVVRI